MQASSTNENPKRHRVEFACNVAAGREAARTLRQFLETCGLPEELLFACELALTEACNNAVHHAGDRGRALPAIAEVTLTNSHVDMAVTDHTDGFEWPGRLTLPDPEIPKGRGLFLIQSIMDEVSYERGQGENVLWMRKQRSV